MNEKGSRANRWVFPITGAPFGPGGVARIDRTMIRRRLRVVLATASVSSLHHLRNLLFTAKRGVRTCNTIQQIHIHRPTTDRLMSQWTKRSFWATVILIGIPTAARFYPPLFEGISGLLPLGFILIWMSRLGLIALGFTLGWYFRERRVQTKSKRVDRIVGCIEKDEVAWKGVATLSRGQIKNIQVPYEALCPKCQTEMNSGKININRGRKRPNRGNSTRNIWRCPNGDCGHTTDRTQKSDAENILKRHIERIVQSEDEEYSLGSLVERIEGEYSGEKLWQEYNKVVDDTHVSTSCFH